jgi:SAM-dependent methyltransferase
MVTIPLERWRAGQADELADWAAWLSRARGGQETDADAAKDLAWRTDPDADLSQREYMLVHLRRHVPPGGTVNVLDVGAGPLTVFPKKWITRTVNVTAVDPLADDYAKLLADNEIVAPAAVTSVAAEAEKLASTFPAGSFDLVFARNAFEQFHDPMLALRQMLAVVKSGQWVLLLQEGHRTPAQSSRAPWVMVEESDEPYVQLGTGEKIDLATELSGVGDVRVVRSWHYPWLLTSIRRA